MHRHGTKIAVLDRAVSRKIAAGEVIDRPCSVLRELLDNSIDAASSEIDCFINDGGISLIEVSDNGIGMTGADLQLCCLSHATSKISTENDLLHIHSLGFRGEALFSIAAVSRLEIISKDESSEEGQRLYSEGDGQPQCTARAARRGTKVKIQDLFYNLPARKAFITSTRGESTLCRNVFLEKAIAHPDISFKLFFDKKSRVLLPALEKGNYLQRIAEVYPDQCKQELLHEISASGEGFSFKIIIGLPPLHRSDRKHIQVYCNRRRIHDFSLMHAVEYAFSSILPGGRYPIAYVFLNIDPAEIDFNIHPSKKEVRFKKPEILHRRIREAIQGFIEFYTRHPSGREKADLPSGDQVLPLQHIAPRSGTKAKASIAYHSQQEARNSQENDSLYVREREHSETDGGQASTRDQTGERMGKHAAYRYLGQIFSVFLLVEIDDELLMIDMHAAHERILFDRYRSMQGSEYLLIPMIIKNEELRDKLKHISPALNKIGFKSKTNSNGELLLSAVPSALRGKERLIEDIISDLGKNADDLETALYENMACRAAVKDGDILDRDTARGIIEQSFQLPVKRCPHGRPIWFALSKKELFQLIGRLV